MNMLKLFVLGAQPVPESAADQKAVAAAEAPLDDTRLTNTELMRLAGWSADDYHLAARSHKLPEADAFRQRA